MKVSVHRKHVCHSYELQKEHYYGHCRRAFGPYFEGFWAYCKLLDWFSEGRRLWINPARHRCNSNPERPFSARVRALRRQVAERGKNNRLPKGSYIRGFGHIPRIHAVWNLSGVDDVSDTSDTAGERCDPEKALKAQKSFLESPDPRSCLSLSALKGHRARLPDMGSLPDWEC
jgi:hypothetical protein